MTDDLQPGPEADALVATAMGWTWQEPSPDGWDGHWVTPDGEIAEHPPAYTTTGNGMLAMMEWVDAKRWAIDLMGPDGEARHWQCCLYAGEAGRQYIGRADTAPLAVAKALLAAVKEADE